MGTLLPEFPNIDELKLPEEVEYDKVAWLRSWHMYFVVTLTAPGTCYHLIVVIMVTFLAFIVRYSLPFYSPASIIR